PRQELTPGAIAQQHVSDCDGDGDPDLFFGLAAPQRNLADGSFESFPPAAPAPPAGELWAGPGSPGDFDGDGDVDLLVTRVEPGSSWPLVHGMNLLVNNGAGTLYDGGAAAAPGVNMNNTTYKPYMDQPAAGRAADADGDGDLDFVALSIGNPDQTKLWWNDGSGFFTPGPAWPGELVFAVEDMNGDTLPDLVMASNMLSVAFGLGGHAFSAPLVLPESDADNISDTYAAADLDGDGDVDVAGVNWHDDRLVVHMNDGAGNFTTDTTSFDSWRIDAHGSIDARVHAIDVDADGINDLVVAPADFARETSLIFLKKNGAPGWEDPIEQAFETHAVADADGDGDDDVFDQTLLRNRAYGMPSAGMRQQYGQGKPGADGTVPVIGASGPFRQGETAVLHMTGANAGAYSILTLGLAASDLPNTPWIGTTGYTWPWAFYLLFVMPGSGQNPGDGKLDLAFTVDPAMAGLGPIYHQVYHADPGAAWGRSTTGGLMIDYEP
ncbi:MAG: FG-GAP-like repeat-containing protein, partial [Planctomycetota bacterium]